MKKEVLARLRSLTAGTLFRYTDKDVLFRIELYDGALVRVTVDTGAMWTALVPDDLVRVIMWPIKSTVPEQIFQKITQLGTGMGAVTFSGPYTDDDVSLDDLEDVTGVYMVEMFIYGPDTEVSADGPTPNEAWVNALKVLKERFDE